MIEWWMKYHLVQASQNGNSNVQNQEVIFNSSTLFRIRYDQHPQEIQNLVKKDRYRNW